MRLYKTVGFSVERLVDYNSKVDKSRFVGRVWISIILLTLELAACSQGQTIFGGGAARPSAVPTAPLKAPPTAILDPGTCLPNPSIRFSGPQGEPLQGGLLGEGETGVVLSNDSGNRACGWGYLIPLLIDSKFRVLVYRYGEQSPIEELLAAVSFFAAQPGIKHVILIGASRGAEATVIVSGRNLPAVVAAVSLSADEYLGGVDPETSAAQVEIPILFFTAQHDPFRSYETAQSLYNLAPSKDKHLVVLPGSQHGVELLSDEAIQTQIMDFIQTYR